MHEVCHVVSVSRCHYCYCWTWQLRRKSTAKSLKVEFGLYSLNFQGQLIPQGRILVILWSPDLGTRVLVVHDLLLSLGERAKSCIWTKCAKCMWISLHPSPPPHSPLRVKTLPSTSWRQGERWPAKLWCLFQKKPGTLMDGQCGVGGFWSHPWV